MPRLTEDRARRAPLPTKGRDLFTPCSELKAFKVRTTVAGARSYVVLVRVNGERKLITLGPVGILAFEGPPDRPGARDLALAALGAARRGHDPILAVNETRRPQGATLGDIWTAYEKAGFPKQKDGYLRQSSLTAYRYRYKNRFAPVEATPMAAIDTQWTQRWLDGFQVKMIQYVQKQCRDEPLFSERQQCLALLKMLQIFAKSRGLAQIQKIDLSPQPSRKTANYLTREELDRLDQTYIELIAEQSWRIYGYCALRLLLATGMRKCEAMALEWRDIDFDESLLRLKRDKTSGREAGREVLVGPDMLAMLKTLPRTASPRVFLTDQRTLHPCHKEALRRAGLKDIRIHDLRHSYASASIRSGVDLYTTGKLIGHKNYTSTLRYAHLDRQALREAQIKVAQGIHGISAPEPPRKSAKVLAMVRRKA